MHCLVGKLLVRCFFCKYSPLSLTKDPSCWSDVTSELITGCCSSCKCEGVRADFYFECIDHPYKDNNATPLKQVINVCWNQWNLLITAARGTC